MSDPAVLAPPDRLTASLLDLELHAEQIGEFLSGGTFADFRADQRLRDATMFNLVRIAETVRRLAPDALAHYPSVDWAALGRFTVERAYEMTEDDWPEAWRIATKAVPALLGFDLPAAPASLDPMPLTDAVDGELRLSLPEDELAAFCRRWRVAELAIFGSALRDDFRPDSDVDFLVTFDPDAPWSLLDHVQMEEELGAILGRKVDLIERRAVETSRNWIRRRSILSTARPLQIHDRNEVDELQAPSRATWRQASWSVLTTCTPSRPTFPSRPTTAPPPTCRA